MPAGARAVPRSLLYTPARSLDRVAKAWSYDADVHVIDLEDSVPPAEKATARDVCRQALDKAPHPRDIAVRINQLGDIEAVRDLAMLSEAPVLPGFLILTMVTTAAEVTLVRDILASIGADPQIYVTVETVEAVTGVDAITRAADGLVFGSADLAATLGVEITWEGMLAARQAMALACARHGAACIDTANFRLSDPVALAEETTRSRALGFHGKVTVHPGELETINRLLRPDAARLGLARRVTAAVRGAGGGVAILDGDMVGPPFARLARDTVAREEAWDRRFGEKVPR